MRTLARWQRVRDDDFSETDLERKKYEIGASTVLMCWSNDCDATRRWLLF
jgi:hypothetical protein